MAIATMPFAGVFVLGAAVAAAVQPITPTGWWLNSADGVRTVALGMGALGLSVMLALPGRHLRESATIAAALWLGVMAGLTAVMFVNGPGNLFPIVLVVAAILSAVPLGLGALIAVGLRRLLKRVT